MLQNITIIQIKNPNQKFDPVTNPYFQFRMLVGSNPRADNFAKECVKLMADINAKEFNYTPTGNKGFLQVLKPFNDNGHADTLLTYIGAIITSTTKYMNNNIKNYQ